MTLDCDFWEDFWDFADLFVRVMFLLIAALFVIPFVAGYFWWNRHAGLR
ncbi:MAG: hypothetical protein KGL39_08085 [Patescibacteria group bacterium]|nr:hypothetical protein [Patescibacteria group bacterium]